MCCKLEISRLLVWVSSIVVIGAILVGCGGGGAGQIVPNPTGFNPTAIGYVANVKSNSVTSFLIDEGTGELKGAATASAAICRGKRPESVIGRRFSDWRLC